MFVIDEINRGNLSKILGELMVLIEPERRGEEYSIPLTYASSRSDRFFVPENVYLLGLMNTADRSLAMVDYALRRRFCFFNLTPAFDRPSLGDHLNATGLPAALVTKIVSQLKSLNAEIEADKDLGPGFRIGHSFFCPPTPGPADPERWYQSVIRFEVAPLLREYWFDAPERANQLIDGLLA